VTYGPSGNCGRSSVMVNHGALLATWTCCVGRMPGSSSSARSSGSSAARSSAYGPSSPRIRDKSITPPYHFSLLFAALLGVAGKRNFEARDNGPEIAVGNPLRRSQRRSTSTQAHKFGDFRQKPTNLRDRATAWWGSEDSNYLPSTPDWSVRCRQFPAPSAGAG